MGRWLLDWLLVFIVRFASWVFCHVPLRAALGAGTCFGALAWAASGKRRRIGLGNLTVALGDRLSLAERRAVIRRVYRNLAWSFVELLRFPRVTRDEIERYVRVDGRQHVEDALARGRGAILLTAHFGNWEMANLYAGLVDRPLEVVVRMQGVPRLNALLDSYRQLQGSRIIRKGSATRQILAALAKGRLVGILADQDAGHRWLRVTMFDRLTSYPRGPFLCSLQAGAPILPVFIVRQPGGRHHILIDQALSVEGDNASRQDRRSIQRLCQQYAAALERAVRRNPDQWLWLHKRWKSAPVERVVILTDGKQGHRQQALAVAEAIERAQRSRLEVLEIEPSAWTLRRQEVEVVYRSRLRRAVWTVWMWARWPFADHVAQWAMTKRTWEEVSSVRADVFIGCGARTIPALLWASSVNQARRVAVMAPRPFSPRCFDVVVAPRHDRYPDDPRVVRTDAVPNMVMMRPPGSAAGNTIGVLIGGNTKRECLSDRLAADLAEQLILASERVGATLAVTTSRRTPESAGRLFRQRLGSYSRCVRLLLAHEQSVDGTAPDIIAAGRVLVVSGESASMVSEAVASGRPVVVFQPETIGGPVRKREAFLEALRSRNRLIVVPVKGVADAVARAWSRSGEPPHAHEADVLVNAMMRVVK